MTLSVINDEGGVFFYRPTSRWPICYWSRRLLRTQIFWFPAISPQAGESTIPAVFLYAQHEGIKTHILPDRNLPLALLS